MYNNEKLRIYIILFLSFFVLSSKNILIFNEETLVALSFFCFLFFVNRYFGNSIRDSFNERSQSIQSRLEEFLTFKSTNYKKLLQQHQKVSGLVTALNSITLFTSRECARLIGHDKKALKNEFQLELQQKLKNLALSSTALQPKLWPRLANKVFSYVFLSFKKAKQQKTRAGNLLKQLQKKSSKKALHLLASNAKTS